MFAHLGPAPPAQGTDLIARAMGGWVLATLGGHGARTPVRRAVGARPLTAQGSKQ
jgi:hypothetical protein